MQLVLFRGRFIGKLEWPSHVEFEPVFRIKYFNLLFTKAIYDISGLAGSQGILPGNRR